MTTTPALDADKASAVPDKAAVPVEVAAANTHSTTTAAPVVDSGFDPEYNELSREQKIKLGKDPSLPPNHPINAMSKLRKWGLVIALSYAGFLCNFSIAICNVSFGEVGKSFGKGPGDIANALGYNLLGCAFGSLIWNPISQSWGRRPVYLIGAFLFMPMCVWEARAMSYGSFVGGRVMAGITASWSQTIPPASIADCHIKEVRGAKMSLYAICTVIGPVIVPIFAAAIVEHHDWRNLFYFNLGTAALQFILCFLLVPETMWNWDNSPPSTPTHHELTHDGQPADADLKASNEHHEVMTEKPARNIPGTATTVRTGHVGPAFLPYQNWREFGRLSWMPIKMFYYIPILVPSFYYGMCLGFLSVGVTVVFPQIFAAPPHNFKVVPLGCAFLAFGIGGVLGKWAGGVVSDTIVHRWERRKGYRQPEFRLWAGYPMLPLMFIGMLLCGLCVTLKLHWMCYLVGGAVAFFSLSGITTVILTYTLECYLSHGMDTQAVFNFCKYLWGFCVPFFLMPWGKRDGFLAIYCAQGALLFGLGAIILTLLIWKGYEIRQWQGMPMSPREAVAR